MTRSSFLTSSMHIRFCSRILNAPLCRINLSFMHFPEGQTPTCPRGCVYETTEAGILGTATFHPLASWDAFESYKAPDPWVTTHWGQLTGRFQLQVWEIHPMHLREIGHGHTFLKLIDIRGYENAIFDMEDNEPRLLKLTFNARRFQCWPG